MAAETKAATAKTAANVNLNIYNALRSVPTEAIKTIGAGRLKGFSDINPMWRIKSLTEQFGPCGFGWYTDIVERWQQEYNNEIAVFVKIHLFVKSGNEWSAPIVGVGGSKIATKESSGIYFSDEGWKMAYTDAISVACKALGMAADIYFDKDKKPQDNRTKYDQQSEAAAPAPEQKPTAAPRASQMPAYKPLPEAVRKQCIEGYVAGRISKDGLPLDRWFQNHTYADEKEMQRFYDDAMDYKSTLTQ